MATQYECDDCEWCGTVEDMDAIDDVQERVGLGELMAAGQCPDCGAMISVAADDVATYTLEICAEIYAARIARAVRLRKGDVYVPHVLDRVGWTAGAPRDGYDSRKFFDRAGHYLGPDAQGNEPLFCLNTGE